MKKRSEMPIEKRSYGWIYFICSTLLAISTLWAVADETWVRRPWKKYQKQFNRLEYNKVKANLDAEEARFLEQKGTIYQQMKEQLQHAEEALKSDEYKEAQESLKRYQREVAEVNQQLQFAKSEYGELYYMYKKAQHEGRDDEYEKKLSLAQQLKEKMNKLNPLREQIVLKRNEAEKDVEKLRNEADSIRDDISEMDRELDRLRDKLKANKNRPLKIEQTVLKGFESGEFGHLIDRVDRCMSCHLAIDKFGFEDAEQPFRTHPRIRALLATHPDKKFGCTPCHGGQGPALKVKAAHGEVEHWEQPLLRGKLAEASCLNCHWDRLDVAEGEVISTAKKMFADTGCIGCHDIKGFYDLEKVGPQLNGMASKVKPEWIFQWLKQPKVFLPKTTMPVYNLSDEETAAATAYLMAIGMENDYVFQSSSVESGSSERGEWLVENIGCRPCHVVGDDQLTRNFRLKEGNNYGPELNQMGDKVNPQWLFDWLKDPKRFRPKSRMPNMRLTDQEAMDIVAYLMTLKTSSTISSSVDFTWLEDLDSEEKIIQGANVIRSSGCFGCHDIKGMENEKKVSVELSDFAEKDVEELFFGDAIAEGKVGGETWDDWIMGKLKNSWVYATEMVEQKMPNFGFSEEKAMILTVLLKSFNNNSNSEEYTEKLNPDEIAVEEGKILLQRNNCLGCHIVEGQGGYGESQIVQTFMGEGRAEEEARAFVSPSLEGEGAKVQPDWLYRFLKNPVTLRPWLRVRMPTYYFSDEEAIIMERYFSKVAKQEFKYEYVEDRRIPAEVMQAAQILYSKDYFNCYSCHQIGDKKPEGDPSGWAPDLTLARDRLKPEWIESWIRDPQTIQRGTKMPSYYPDSYPPDILGGDPEKQIRAMTDYLMSLRKEEQY